MSLTEKERNMLRCLDCNAEVSLAHTIINPTHKIVATFNDPRTRIKYESMIARHRWKANPPKPEPLEGADETYNIRKDRATDDTQVSLWWLAIPAAIAIGIGIFVYRRNEEPVPDNSEDAYYG